MYTIAIGRGVASLSRIKLRLRKWPECCQVRGEKIEDSYYHM
jgi:hypothetical protein